MPSFTFSTRFIPALSWILLLTMAAPVRAEKMHCPNVTDNDEKNTEVARRYFQMGGMYHDKQDFTRAGCRHRGFNFYDGLIHFRHLPGYHIHIIYIP